jgi:hypothetical protein
MRGGRHFAPPASTRTSWLLRSMAITAGGLIGEAAMA